MIAPECVRDGCALLEPQDSDPIASRLQPIPAELAEESATCPRCRRRGFAVGRIGRRLVFRHCVHYFRTR